MMGKALLSKEDRDDLLMSLAMGEKPSHLAEDYSLTVKQVMKMRNNYKAKFYDFKKILEEQEAKESKRNGHTSDPIMTALIALNGKASVCQKTYRAYLNGRHVSYPQLVEAANNILTEQKKELIRYPGVNAIYSIEGSCGPSMRI